MKVSLNTIRQFIDFELPPVDKLVRRINQQLGGVEEVIDLGAKYKDARIVRVVECEKHPNADKLSVCKIDAGEKELVQVVCGAPNARTDMWAVWLPPGSTVPMSYDDKEPFVLDARELRGVMSHGMLAAGDELAINSDHDGIIEITDYDMKTANKLHQGESLMQLRAGDSFAKVFGLDDTIIDIENKMFTHRPDCFGQLGVAREIAGILGHQFTSPEWYQNLPAFTSATGLELTTFNSAGDKVPRVMFVAMQNVEIRPSPLWLQCELVRMGSKAINNIVDATNYIMLITAQPTHAYDYDTLRGHKIGARMARAGEKLSVLNGKTYELTEDDIVIADDEGAIGLGGIMGGRNSEVSAGTRSVVLEVASFDMYAVRRSSMRHGVFTDALTRFNKGQSKMQNPYVMNRLMELVTAVSSARQASAVVDDIHGSRITSRNVTTTNGFINERLGLELDKDDIQKVLNNVEFTITQEPTVISITAPFWRTDIELPEDIVEEVGRLYGFDTLPRELPSRSTKPAPKNQTRIITQLIRESLSRMGGNEVLTYSFVHENIMKCAEQDVAQAFQLSNALSPDLKYYRQSVLPSLLDKVHGNSKSGYDEFILFEIGKGHSKTHPNDSDGLPTELRYVDAVYTNKSALMSAPYYTMRRVVEELARELGMMVKFASIQEATVKQSLMPFDMSRSAEVFSHDGVKLGVVGELKQSVIKHFKLSPNTAAMTLDLAAISYDAGSCGNH